MAFDMLASLKKSDIWHFAALIFGLYFWAPSEVTFFMELTKTIKKKVKDIQLLTAETLERIGNLFKRSVSYGGDWVVYRNFFLLN